MCNPTALCCCPRSGYGPGNQQCGLGNSATLWRQSQPGSRSQRNKVRWAENTAHEDRRTDDSREVYQQHREREMINRKWLARTWATFGLKWKHSTSEVWWQSDLCGGKHRVLVQTEYSIGGDSVVGQKAAAYHLVWFGKHKQMWLGERKEQTALLCSWLPNDTVWISLIWAQVRCMCLTDGTNSQCLSCLFVLQSCSSYRVSDSTNTPC